MNRHARLDVIHVARILCAHHEGCVRVQFAGFAVSYISGISQSDEVEDGMGFELVGFDLHFPTRPAHLDRVLTFAVPARDLAVPGWFVGLVDFDVSSRRKLWPHELFHRGRNRVKLQLSLFDIFYEGHSADANLIDTSSVPVGNLSMPWRIIVDFNIRPDLEPAGRDQCRDIDLL